MFIFKPIHLREYTMKEHNELPLFLNHFSKVYEWDLLMIYYWGNKFPILFKSIFYPTNYHFIYMFFSNLYMSGVYIIPS